MATERGAPAVASPTPTPKLVTWRSRDRPASARAGATCKGAQVVNPGEASTEIATRGGGAVHLNAKARIWPRLSYVCHIRSIVAVHTHGVQVVSPKERCPP